MKESKSQHLTFEMLEPIELGMDKDKLLEMDRIIPLHYKNLNGMIVLRYGKVAFEQYYNGFGLENHFHVASITKSIISCLIGIAVDKGYIENLDQKVLDFFPEYYYHSSEIQKKAITLRHLLTMRAPYIFKPLQEPMEKLVKQKDWIKFSLDMLGKNGNIGEFKYSNCGVNILSAILNRTTGQSAREFANNNLFKQIEIKEIEDNPNQSFDYDGLFGDKLKGWAKDPHGNSTGGWGLTLTTRDMARFGSLYMNDGYMNHQQVISKEWIQESIQGIPFEKKIPVVFQQYGYLWCIYKKEGLFAYMALGDGGNMICCIPKEKIVVAISSKTMRKPRERWELIKDYILPSIIK